MTKQNSNPNFHHWIIYLDKKVVGYVRILDYDIGIIVDQKFGNKGIATKGLQLVEIEAKKLGIKKLVAMIDIENKSSIKIFEKNNYKFKMYLYEKILN